MRLLGILSEHTGNSVSGCTGFSCGGALSELEEFEIEMRRTIRTELPGDVTEL